MYKDKPNVKNSLPKRTVTLVFVNSQYFTEKAKRTIDG